MMISVLTSCDLSFLESSDDDNGVIETPDTDLGKDSAGDRNNTDGKTENDNVQDPPASGGGESGGNTEAQINYGTLSTPVSTTYAYGACAGFDDGECSVNPFYVKGTVTKIGEDKGNYYKNVYFTDGTTEMLIYTINMGSGISGFDLGDTIVAYGYIKNYQGTIEMATYNSSVYVYVVAVESAVGGDQGGGNTSAHTYTDFKDTEKSMFQNTVGAVIPFLPNDDYVVEEVEYDGIMYISFYTFGNTEAEFDAYRALFSDYTYDGSDLDEYGDAWYYYSKGDVCVEMSFYYYEGDYVVDIYAYVFSSDDDNTESGGESGGNTEAQINYGTLSTPVSTTYAYGACAGFDDGECSVNPFYVKGTVTKIGEDKGNYYKNVYFTDGTTEMLIYTINMGSGISGFDLGDTIVAYGYIKNYQGTIEMATYNSSVYVYVVKLESSDGNQGGETGSDANILTNDGKGLPTEADGVYDVDFTEGNYVKDVTDQGYYLDGCPTTGSPAVLVIPIEFSDATAQSKGYTIANLEKIFHGSTGDLSYYSVYEYFLESSYGKLTLDITVVDQWFRPKYSSSYYENRTTVIDGYEIEIGDQMILDEALAYLAGIMDLSKFDSDHNGVIDAVILVNTLEIGEDDFHWAYRYWNSYTDSDGYYYEYDNVSANDYVWLSYEFMFEFYDENGDVDYSHSNPLNPYTFIHEFSHVLGADDYYDTSYESSPMGGYDVMDSMAGDHNPYSKFNYGWITTSRLVVTNSSITLTLDAFAKNGDTILLANHWDPTLGAYQEYYIIMYYTATGLNDGDGGYFTRDGILVYHINSSIFVDQDYGETYYDVYNNNTSPSDEYGTEDNLVEFVLTSNGHYTYVAGDSLPIVTDDSGNTLGYTFTVDSLTADSATITFTKK